MPPIIWDLRIDYLETVDKFTKKTVIVELRAQFLYLPNEGKLLLVEEDGDLLNLTAGSYDLLHNLRRRR